MFIKGDLPVLNFTRVFPIGSKDNSGWEELQSFFKTDIFIIMHNNNICLPQNGNYFNNIAQDRLLCFRNIESKHWVIESVVQAGD